MAERQTVVRKCSKIGKARLHDLLMIGWSRAIAKFGKGPFAEALDISTVAVDKHLSGSMPGFEAIVDAYSIDDDVLNEVLSELGVRVVPKDATCDSDDLKLLLARVMLKIQEAEHPDSPGGRAIVHQEYLDCEANMRALHKMSGDWLEVCAQIRRPREVA